jgi:hypothetical protein
MSAPIACARGQPPAPSLASPETVQALEWTPTCRRRQRARCPKALDEVWPRNLKGKPQLGRRGLYATMGEQREASYDQMALLWVLNLADGHHTLLDIAERARLSFATVRAVADALVGTELLDTTSA